MGSDGESFVVVVVVARTLTRVLGMAIIAMAPATSLLLLVSLLFLRLM